MSGKCDRSGMCCTLFYISKSPAELKQLAEKYIKYEWNKDPESSRWRYDEVYRMIGDRCIGYSKKYKGYFYGPCRNLFFKTDENGQRLACCSIQSIKPGMCSDFPNRTDRNDPDDNPSGYKGCGFNKSRLKGSSLKQMYKAIVK